MSDKEKAGWMAKGHKMKTEIKKMDPALSNWEILSKTLGFYQYRTKNSITSEQISLLKAGFEHERAI